MKRSILVSLFAITILNITAFAGQGRKPAEAGARPANPGASDHLPTNVEKPESRGVSPDHQRGVSADHQANLPTQAVDPKDTHGFKNYGQYVAAQHVAKNLNIPGGVDALKKLMVGDGGVSLGKAIHQLRPELSQQSIDAEVKKAEAAAKKAEAKKGNKPTE